MNKFLFYTLMLLFSFSNVSAANTLPFCNVHEREIGKIRNDAGESICQAHLQGGHLFRTSYVFTPSEAAFSSVRYQSTYTQFSEVFLDFMSYCQPEGLSALYFGQAKMTDDFFEMYNNCIEKHSSLSAHYERGRIYFDKGLYANCLTDIQPIVESGKWDLSEKDKIEEKKFLLMRGMAQLESNAYEEAIDTLCDLINKDPKNKEAYLNRASAYFETGNFELALSDYIASEKSKNFDKVKFKTSDEFNIALIQGLFEGGSEAAIDFFPSLCESAYGLSTCLWNFVDEPIRSTANFCNACYEAGETVVDYIKTLDKGKIEEIAIEIQDLCEHFSSMSDAEKGRIIGHCIGKYGIDLFAGATVLKCASAIKNLKTANRILNLERLATSEKSREAIKAVAITHAAKREAHFANVKIHWDRQNKHVPGKHNYIEGRSVFERPNAQDLLDRFAGKGVPIKDRIPGKPDYREKINFHEHIGYHINDKTGVKTKTTFGEVRYSEKGAHIIPSFQEND